MVQELVVDNNIAFLPSIGSSYQLNETAISIINKLKNNKSKDEIIKELLEEYDVSESELFIDVNDFFQKLRFYGLYYGSN